MPKEGSGAVMSKRNSIQSTEHKISVARIMPELMIKYQFNKILPLLIK